MLTIRMTKALLAPPASSMLATTSMSGCDMRTLNALARRNLIIRRPRYDEGRDHAYQLTPLGRGLHSALSSIPRNYLTYLVRRGRVEEIL